MKKNIRRLFLVAVGILVLAVSLPESSINPLGYRSVEAASNPTINKKKVTLKWGKTANLKVKSAPKKVKWSSSNPNVCKIKKTKGSKKQTAVIQAVNKGSATITAKTGSKSLKVKVTVKHTHSYTYPATCLAPAHCECGATIGTTVDHSFSNGHCIWCGILDLKNMLKLTPLRTAATGNYNMRYVGVKIENRGIYTLVALGGTTVAQMYPSSGASPLTLYLTDANDRALLSAAVPSGGTSTVWYDTMDNNSTFTFTPTGRLEFMIMYGERTYKIVLSIDGTFTFSQIS